MEANVADVIDTDVLVVGAGPSGSATAYYLARAGVDVALIEKSKFPRDKICGDGLTPAAVAEVHLMGVDTTGWTRNTGLHVIGGGHSIYLPWPEQKSTPDFGMTRTRMQLDEELARRAQSAGVHLYEEHAFVRALETKTGRVCGIIARVGRGKQAREVTFRAKAVVDAGGVAARLATSRGIEKLAHRPLGVAARAYFKTPLGDGDWMESHLELWSGTRGESELLPGYGWIFPMGNGVANVGLGSVSSNAKATTLPYRDIFRTWTANLPEEWELTEQNQQGPLRSAALPMSFNRKPHYENGLVIVGDAGGMVSPFNGEGIAPGMRAGRYAAESIVSALSRRSDAGFDLAMETYTQALAEDWGGYYSLGRVFVRLIENPKIMRLCTKYGLPRRRLMKLVHKLLSDSFERKGGDFDDHLIATLSKVVPKV
ncbi:geranylgeranyl reductase family protein [Gleimia hominis]|uniref:Geranylgeranyl reductase family protein n=1 Tax=Gleimia hominis TaxID=595468 RepID=A0ABU3I9P6_9ACTO|nr:geranylgeranyl reductase family protein [Gleimia hominis]MDT3767093.1 geranylgeranyl reductase family protein [Gleimia hominis]